MSIDLDTARRLLASSGRHVVPAPTEVLDVPDLDLAPVVLTDGAPALWVVPESVVLAASGAPLHHLDDEVLDDMLDEIRHDYAREIPASIAR